jgi:hypothetical protein
VPSTGRISEERRAEIRAEALAERAKGVPMKVLVHRYNISRTHLWVIMNDLKGVYEPRGGLPKGK